MPTFVAKHLTLKVPDATLDHWNSPSKLPGGNIITIGNRKKILLEQIQGDSRFCKWRAGECCRTAVIEVAIPKHPTHMVSGSARQAKVLASEKIKKNVADLNVRSSNRMLPMSKPKCSRMLPMGITKPKCSRQSRSRRLKQVYDSLSDESELSVPTLNSLQDIHKRLSLNGVNHSTRHTGAMALVKDFSIDLTRLPSNETAVRCERAVDCRLKRMRHSHAARTLPYIGRIDPLVSRPKGIVSTGSRSEHR